MKMFKMPSSAIKTKWSNIVHLDLNDLKELGFTQKSNLECLLYKIICTLNEAKYLNNLEKLSSLGCSYIDHCPNHILLLNCIGNRQNTQMLQKLKLD